MSFSDKSNSPTTPVQQLDNDNESVYTQIAEYGEQPALITSQGAGQQTQISIESYQAQTYQQLPPNFTKKFLSIFSTKSNSTPNTSNPFQLQTSSQKGLFQKNLPSRSVVTGYPRRVMTEGWDTKPPCAVIVTIYSSSSYDTMFRSVPQQSPDPQSSIAVFEMDYATIRLFLQYINLFGRVDTSMMPQSTIDAIKDIVDAIAQVECDAVVFNFECCAYCNDKSGFDVEGETVLQLIKHNIDSGYMTMFGDFSVKALIKDWNSDLLGPLPFRRIAVGCGDSMLLAFDSAKLLECPSAQLQNVGKLHDGVNTAQLHCLGGTIVFTLAEGLDSKLSSEPVYKVDVLTIATKIDGVAVSDGHLSVDRYSGYAGHVLLTYNNEKRGKILVSAGHWIELSHMGAETERMFSAMGAQYGREFEQQLRSEYESAPSEEKRSELVQRNVRQLVQSSAPCSYSKRKY